VGVVENVRLLGVVGPGGDVSEGIIYPMDPRSSGTRISYAIRVAPGQETILPDIRAAVWEIDPDQPIETLWPAEAALSDALVRERFFLIVMGVFAVVALTLAAVGLFGVLSFVVSQRLREIGVRVALGAGAGRVRRLVLMRGMRLAAGGVGVGALLAFYASRFLQEQLYETSRTDAVTFVAVSASMLLVAALASYLPAGRATRVDPVEVLRSE
jgi:ABC-type antimicrobial peptide transport system permease subunit